MLRSWVGLLMAGLAGLPGPAMPRGELIAELPELGRLTWRCDGDGRSSTRLTLPRPGASVFATVRSDGRTVVPRRRVDPAPAAPGRVSTPLAPARHQLWRLRQDTEPRTIRAVVRLRFAESENGDCFVARAITDVRTTPH